MNSFSFGSANSSTFAFAPNFASSSPPATAMPPNLFSRLSSRPDPGWIGSAETGSTSVCWWASIANNCTGAIQRAIKDVFGTKIALTRG